jgi:hypothetical protein
MIRAKHFREHHKLDGGSSEKIGEATQRGRQESTSSEMMEPVWQLQQQVGNQTVQQLLRSGFIQTKPTISNPDDPEEREADEVARKVMRSHAGAPASTPCSCSHDSEMCEECQQKQSQPTIQRRASAPAAPAHVPQIVSDVLRSPGHPLDSSTRAFFEPRFGHDFSHVRIHTDPEAAESARAINALAYTAGHHLVFGPHQYSPTASSSCHLIAHELAHFVQQRFVANSPVLWRQPAPDIQSPPSGPVEISGRSQYRGPEVAELTVKLLELADNGMRDPAFYKDAIRTSGPVEKRYVYRNPYTLARLADILDLLSYDQCVALLHPDARGGVLAGMARIKKKYGLGEVSEDGATWSESELEIADRNFSKMTKHEQEMLHGLRLIRKNEIPSEERHGKKFPIVGLTTGGSTIELTRSAFGDPFSILHEAGHLIQQKLPVVGLEALRVSETFTNMEPARQKYNDAAKEAKKATVADPDFEKSLHQMADAVVALRESPDDSVQENESRLSMAEGQAELDRAKERSKPWLDALDRLKEYASAVQKRATQNQEIKRAPGDIEKSFVDIVKKYKLNTRNFAPFTDYVAHSWPDKPQEFLVQCYATWRANPGYLRSNAPKLFEWFESGGHLGMSKPAK